MRIEGNLATANKFYIINSFNSIEWVPNIEIAKKYVMDPRCIEWYGKTIYATSEDLVMSADGRVVLKSSLHQKEEKPLTEEDFKVVFNAQALNYNKDQIDEYVRVLGFNNLYEGLSWISSGIKEMSNKAKLLSKYRDKVQTFYLKSLENFIEKAKTGILNNVLTEACTAYVNDFPKFEE